MLKKHAQLLNLLMRLSDLLVVLGAWLLAYTMRFIIWPTEMVPHTRAVIANLGVALLICAIVFGGAGLYKPRRDKSFLLELGQLIKAALLAWVVLIVFIYFTSPGFFTRSMLGIFLFVLMAGLVVERGLFRAVLRFMRRKGWNLRHAYIVGTGRLAQSTYLKLQRNSWTGIRVHGFIDTATEPPRRIVRGLPVIGSTQQLGSIVEQSGVDCVFVALPSQQGDVMRKVVNELERTAVEVRIVPDLFLSRFPAQVGVGELDGLPILTLRENPLAGWPTLYKRVFDIFGALFGLLVFGLPMLAIAVAIKFNDGGPVFYRQRRISYGRRAFNMIKFRTMVLGAEDKGATFAAPNDTRCTPLGRVLRTWSLDELPQLFNVLTGDMSLVGPRPERPEMLAKIRAEVPGFPQRLVVRAGLTGWAQINGFRGRTSFRKRLQYDLYYVNNWSPLLDLRIVIATFFRGFKHPNAY